MNRRVAAVVSARGGWRRQRPDVDVGHNTLNQQSWAVYDGMPSGSEARQRAS